MIEETPSIKKILIIFDPTTFPIAKSTFPFRTAINEVTNSGNEVPTAITVIAIILSGIPNSLEIAVALSTISLPPKMSPAKPTNNQNIAIKIRCCLPCISTSLFSFLANSRLYTKKIIARQTKKEQVLTQK